MELLSSSRFPLVRFGALVLLGALLLPNSWDTSGNNSNGFLCVAAQQQEDSMDNDNNGGCDFSPSALTRAFGTAIPQTCLEVPNKDGTTTKRCFYTYVPDSVFAKNSDQVPLVFDIHGLGSCPLYSAQYTGWKELAESEGFVVVWPAGNAERRFLMGNCWNLPGQLSLGESGSSSDDLQTLPCCCISGLQIPDPQDPDDLLFLRMVLDAHLERTFESNAVDTASDVAGLFGEEVTSRNNNNNYAKSAITIDPTRVYMAGHSNGCMTSLAMAAVHSEAVAAVCCHAGAVVTPFGASGYTPVPVQMIHGVKDTIVPYNGTTFLNLPPVGNLGFLAVEPTLDYLARKNGCEGVEAEDLVDEASGARVGTLMRRNNCSKGATVEVVALDEAGHVPYQAKGAFAMPASYGYGSMAPVDTTAMAWEFCSSHASNYERSESMIPEQTQPMVPSLSKDDNKADANTTMAKTPQVNPDPTPELPPGLGALVGADAPPLDASAAPVMASSMMAMLLGGAGVIGIFDAL